MPCHCDQLYCSPNIKDFIEIEIVVERDLHSGTEGCKHPPYENPSTPQISHSLRQNLNTIFPRILSQTKDTNMHIYLESLGLSIHKDL